MINIIIILLTSMILLSGCEQNKLNGYEPKAETYKDTKELFITESEETGLIMETIDTVISGNTESEESEIQTEKKTITESLSSDLQTDNEPTEVWEDAYKIILENEYASYQDSSYFSTFCLYDFYLDGIPELILGDSSMYGNYSIFMYNFTEKSVKELLFSMADEIYFDTTSNYLIVDAYFNVWDSIGIMQYEFVNEFEIVETRIMSYGDACEPEGNYTGYTYMQDNITKEEYEEKHSEILDGLKKFPLYENKGYNGNLEDYIVNF